MLPVWCWPLGLQPTASPTGIQAEGVHMLMGLASGSSASTCSAAKVGLQVMPKLLSSRNQPIHRTGSPGHGARCELSGLGAGECIQQPKASGQCPPQTTKDPSSDSPSSGSQVAGAGLFLSSRSLCNSSLRLLAACSAFCWSALARCSSRSCFATFALCSASLTAASSTGLHCCFCLRSLRACFLACFSLRDSSASCWNLATSAASCDPCAQQYVQVLHCLQAAMMVISILN